MKSIYKDFIFISKKQNNGVAVVYIDIINKGLHGGVPV
jgi:hypothetical protein